MKTKTSVTLVLLGSLLLGLGLGLFPNPALAQFDEFGSRAAFTPDRTAIGALGAADNAVTVLLNGRTGVGGYVTTGSLSGTVTPEVTIDGTNWIATSVYTISAGTAPSRASTVSLNTLFAIEIPPGAKQARIRVSAYTSGTSTGTLIATATPGSIFATALGGGGGNGAILDGTSADQADVENATLASSTLEGLVVRPYMPGNGTLTATVRDTGSNDSQNVAIVDASGNQITSFGGGTEYTDKSAFTEGTSGGIKPVGGVFNDTISGDPAEDQITPLRITAKKGLHTNLRNNAGTEVGTSSNPLRFDPTNATVTQVQINSPTTFQVQGDRTNNGAPPSSTNVGALTVIANAADPSWTEGRQTSLSTVLAGYLRVGTKTNNAAAPGATNVGALTAIANASAPTWTEGNLVGLSTNLAGALRVTGGGGGTEYLEDDVAPADPTGATFLMTRDDQLATVTEAEGDWSRPRSTAKGALWVALADSAGDPITSFGGGTEYNQGTATTDTDALKMAGAVRRDTAAVATGVVDGDRLALSTDNVGRLRTTAADTTQPISGTVTANAGSGTFAISAASLPLPTGAATSANQTTEITALEIIDNLPLAQGSTTSGQSGPLIQGAVTTSAPAYTTAQTSPLSLQTDGDLRVEIEDALPAGTNNIGDVDVLTMPTVTVTATDLDIHNLTAANDKIDVAQMNGVAVTMGNGASGTGVQRVTIADDSTGEVRVADDAGNQIPSSTATPALNARGLNVRLVSPDPCSNEKATPFNVNLASATTTLVATGVGSEHVYICSVNLVVGAAQGVAFIAGTGATCGTSTAGMNGGTTGATGWQFAANGGIALPNTGFSHMSTEISGGATGDSVCIVTSTAAQTSGTISYVIQAP